MIIVCASFGMDSTIYTLIYIYRKSKRKKKREKAFNTHTHYTHAYVHS